MCENIEHSKLTIKILVVADVFFFPVNRSTFSSVFMFNRINLHAIRSIYCSLAILIVLFVTVYLIF